MEPNHTPVQITETNVVAGNGLVAQQNYKQGALILQEDALVLCNTRKRHEYWEDEAKVFYDAELNGTTKILQTAFNKLSLPDQATFHKFYTSNPRPTNAEHIVDRFRYSAFKIPIGREGGEPAITHMVLYRTIGFANHSCIPNAAIYIDNHNDSRTKGQGRLVATQDVDNGEEILTNYMPDQWNQPRPARQDDLMLGWGFDCNCKGCDDDHENRDWAERRICSAYFAATEDLNLNDTKLRVLIDLLGELGKRDKELSYACYLLADYYFKRQEYKEAVHAAQKGLLVEEHFYRKEHYNDFSRIWTSCFLKDKSLQA